MTQDIKNCDEDKSTLAPLKILTMGREQIEAGKFKPAREVFAQMDKEILESAAQR